MIYEAHNSTDDQLRFYRLEDCSFHPHLHKNLEVIFCCSGCVQVTISGRTYRLTAGQGAVVPPNAVHSFLTERACVFYIVQAGLQQVRDVAQLFRDRVPSDCTFRTGEDMQRRLQSTFAGKEWNSFDVKGLLYQAVGAFAHDNTFTEGRSADTELLTCAIRYVQDNFREHLTLEDVARHLGYSYSYVSKRFKQGLHMSFSDFLTEYRVSYARALLGEGETSISQAALQAGFGSIRNFNRVFLRVTGETPRAWQKRGKGTEESGKMRLELERDEEKQIMVELFDKK